MPGYLRGPTSSVCCSSLNYLLRPILYHIGRLPVVLAVALAVVSSLCFHLVNFNKHKRSRRKPKAHSVLYFVRLSCLMLPFSIFTAHSGANGNN